jgi:hypothetical protein
MLRKFCTATCLLTGLVGSWPLQAQVTCTVSWYFDDLGSTKSYVGAGPSEKAAIRQAAATCVSSEPDRWKGYCATNPTNVDCLDAGECVSSASLSSTGYPSKGHKTNWCRSQGFDGYDNDEKECIRTCLSECEKVAIRALGWTQGNKTRFCQTRGFEGVHNPSASPYNFGGYCWNGPRDICKTPP